MSTSSTHMFREVGYQLPRPHDDSPVRPDPTYAPLLPKQVKK